MQNKSILNKKAIEIAELFQSKNKEFIKVIENMDPNNLDEIEKCKKLFIEIADCGEIIFQLAEDVSLFLELISKNIEVLENNGN